MAVASGFLGFSGDTWFALILFFLGAAISASVSFLIYRRQKSPRTLDYALKSTEALVTSGGNQSGLKLSVVWETSDSADETRGASGTSAEVSASGPRALHNPRISNFHIRNTGRRAIDAEDFAKPITVEVPRTPPSCIVDVHVTGVSSDGIHPCGSIPDPPKGLKPVLMNPGDWIEVQVLTDAGPADPVPILTAWIRDQSRPMARRQGLLDPPLEAVLRRRVSRIPPHELWSFFLIVAAFIVVVTLSFF
jgi:hypothetical protein